MNTVTPITNDSHRSSTHLVTRILGFAGISIVGLLLDCALFVMLTMVGLQAFVANLLSAGTAVTFVFFASVRQIFRFSGQRLWPRYLGYVIFQVIAVTAASWLIAWLRASTALPALTCKLAVLPLTFAANFLFMRLITRGNPP